MRAKQFLYINNNIIYDEDLAPVNKFKPPTPVALAAVRSNAVVLLLLSYCCMNLLLFVGVLCLSLFWYALLCVLSKFAINLTRKKELVCVCCLLNVLLL